ncbi:MAG: hypothetical protein P8171_07605 [Candidatus Thiodiazotropha sp.]
MKFSNTFLSIILVLSLPIWSMFIQLFVSYSVGTVFGDPDYYKNHTWTHYLLGCLITIVFLASCYGIYRRYKSERALDNGMISSDQGISSRDNSSVTDNAGKRGGRNFIRTAFAVIASLVISVGIVISKFGDDVAKGVVKGGDELVKEIAMGGDDLAKSYKAEDIFLESATKTIDTASKINTVLPIFDGREPDSILEYSISQLYSNDLYVKEGNEYVLSVENSKSHIVMKSNGVVVIDIEDNPDDGESERKHNSKSRLMLFSKGNRFFIKDTTILEESNEIYELVAEIKFSKGSWSEYLSGNPVIISYTDEGSKSINENILNIMAKEFMHELSNKFTKVEVASKKADSSSPIISIDKTTLRTSSNKSTFTVNVYVWK